MAKPRKGSAAVDRLAGLLEGGDHAAAAEAARTVLADPGASEPERAAATAALTSLQPERGAVVVAATGLVLAVGVVGWLLLH